MGNTDSLMYREEIQRKVREIERLYSDINRIAKSVIPDYHFMTHKVSTFWPCDDSPLGVCVFKIDDEGRVRGCYFCGKPVERK